LAHALTAGPGAQQVIELNQHDRFIVTRRRRVTLSPSLRHVDIYEFALADADVDAPPFCHVRQRLSRSNVRIGFLADEPMMYLHTRPRFDPWARCELTDAGLNTIGEIQKEFVPRRRLSHYVLYGANREEVARVEPHVPVALGRRRAGGVAVGAAAAVLGIPFVGPAGVAAVAALAVTTGVRQLRDWVDPLDVASQLRIVRGDQTIGVVLRQPGPGTSTTPLPWESHTRVYEIDMRADPSNSVDRRLVLAVPVALDVLRGVFAESPLR
jgi:hypothetical protein